MNLKSLIISSLVFLSASPLASAEDCHVEEMENADYSAQVISVRNKFRVDPGEELDVKVFMMNTGNVPWFSDGSQCNGYKMFLGTDKSRDRDSEFYNLGKGWVAPNRIRMRQLRVDPGEVATFNFTMQSDEEGAVFKEYFTPVVEAREWLDDARFEVDFMVGDSKHDLAEVRDKIRYAASSGEVMEMINLSGQKWLKVDLSEQMMEVYIGDTVIREFPVSTGAYSTPTPVGVHMLIGKNDVRIGSKSPHYIMPRFQLMNLHAFRNLNIESLQQSPIAAEEVVQFNGGFYQKSRGTGFTGYGIHALPSLGSRSLRNKIRTLQRNGEEVPHELYESDVLWTEAWDHLGTAVSHGCTRVSPVDADFLFEFTEDYGTPYVVVR